ncbi:hypothetical protein SCALM49S_09132 [Streptomyces californicus]
MPSAPTGMIFFNDSACVGSPPLPTVFGSVSTACRGWVSS